MRTQTVSVSCTWSAAVDSYAEYLRAGDRRRPVATSTIEGYLKHVGWLAESAVVGPWQMTSRHLEAWLGEQNWSRDTRRKVLVSIRGFYRWAVGAGLCMWAPTAGVQSSTPRTRGPAPTPLPAAWVEPVADFVATLRAGGRSEGTIRQRKWRLHRLAEVTPDPWVVTRQQLALWLSCPDWAPQTKRASRSAVTMFYRWAVRVGHIAKSPAEDLDTVRCPRALPRPAPRDVIREAMAGADDWTRLALMLAGYAGLRRAEIAVLHTSAIGPGQLMVVGKGGHHRVVPLHPELERELQAEMERRRQGRPGSGWGEEYVTETGYLFPSDRSPGPVSASHLGKRVREALPRPWTAHNLRHYFATAAYAQQRDLRAVQELLGHSKPETTALYAAVPDGALRTAVSGIVI